MTGSTQSAGPANRLQLQTTENGTGQQQHPFAELLEKPAAFTSIYDKISDPLAFVSQMGKAFAFAGVAGCNSQPEGECLAWALLEMRKNWVEFAGEFHMMMGKPELKAHAILARIRRAGGKVRWVNQGDDLTEASAEFTIDGETTLVRYTWADAVRAKIQGFEKSDSAWQRSGGAMLRAAMSRKAAKMLCPEVLTGDCDTEEFSDDQPQAATSTKTVPSAADIEARKRELLQAADPTGVGQVTADPNVTQQQPASTSTTDKPVEEKPKNLSADDLHLGATIDDIVAVAKALNMLSRDALEVALKSANPTFAGLESLGVKGAESLLANLKSKLPDGHNLKK